MIRSEQWPISGIGVPPGRPALRKGNPVTRLLSTLAFLADASTRRKGGRRFWSAIVALLAVGGVTLMGYPLATSFWAHHLQSNLRKQLQTQSYLDAYKRKIIKPGDALTTLIITKIGVNVVVVEGINGNALRAGAGHYPQADYPGSVLPGDVGNVAIAGHRTGFGEPFRHLDILTAGDTAQLITPLGKYTYEVVPPFDGHGNPWITGPTDLSVVAATPEPVLTLTTCDPPHTSKNRLIVRAKLIKTEST